MQKIVGVLLYCSLAIDDIILVGLGGIAIEEIKATANTQKALNWLLDYAITHLNAKICYQVTEMALWADSDVSYLSCPKAKS